MSYIKELQELYELFVDIDIDCIEIKSELGEFSLSFAQNQIQQENTSVANTTICTAVLATNNTEISSCIVDVKSPAIGIFDRAHPKTKEYYIKLRDQVKNNQILGHIHVLGVLHDIIAPANGKIVEFLVEQDQPIEYGQPIMRLEVIK